MKKLAVLVFCLCAGSSLFAADTEVGRIISLTGKVFIDAFGKNAFIPAIKGDIIYQSSVIRTELDGKATVAVQGRQQEIPPAATVRIADLLSASARKGGQGWLQALGNLLRSVSEASQKKQEDLVLGSRAANVEETAEEGMGWMDEEEEASELYEGAQTDIRDQRYADALAKLLRIEAPSDKVLAWNAAFWKGFCYFQLEDYGDAARHLEAAQQALGSSPASLGTPFTRRLLLFQLGACRYFLGEERRAIPYLDRFLAEKADGDYEPYATLLLAKALIASGDSRRAKSVLSEASSRYRGKEIEKEFSLLLKGL